MRETLQNDYNAENGLTEGLEGEYKWDIEREEITMDEPYAYITTVHKSDPNIFNAYDDPAYLRQSGDKGNKTRAMVFCHALTLADAQSFFDLGLRRAQMERWLEEETD